MASPELAGLLRVLREHPAIVGETLHERRAHLASISARLPREPDVSYQPVDAGGVPAEWISAPGSRADRALVHLHGGAYVMGGLDSHRKLATWLAREARARVLLVDYRLAPEHPHPAAVDDAAAALRHVLAQGVAPERLAVSGDSAGGGLVVAALLALRDAGSALPAAGACLSPWFDLTLSGASVDSLAETDVLLDVAMLREAAQAYLGGADPRQPTASPLFAELSGLPPLLVQAGSEELLLDDARRLAERARGAGVDVELEVADGMFHAWHAFADVLPEARQAIARLAAFLEKRWT